jgi:protein-tyrosine-phosphatase
VDAELRAAVGETGAVLFLCSGNIVRSAFAELLARHRGCPLPVRSAGTTYDNQSGVDPRTARALQERGVPRAEVAAFRSRHVDSLGSLEPGTLVLGMTRAHLDDFAQQAFPGYRMLRLVGEDRDLLDPMFHGGFEACFARLDRCVDALVAELLRA